MSWLKVSVAVLVSSAALTVVLLATGAVLVTSALASTVHTADVPAQARATQGRNVPPELARLKGIPPDERFAHFKGIKINLSDRDGNPMDIAVTPGVATSINAGVLTIAGNDGVSHTYALNDQTLNRNTVIVSGDKVVVVTIDDTSTARAVLSGNPANWHHD